MKFSDRSRNLDEQIVAIFPHIAVNNVRINYQRTPVISPRARTRKPSRILSAVLTPARPGACKIRTIYLDSTHLVLVSHAAQLHSWGYNPSGRARDYARSL